MAIFLALFLGVLLKESSALTPPQNQDGLCAKAKAQVSGAIAPGMFVPQCKEDGSYENLQCHSSVGSCWCVDPATGEAIEGTARMVRGDEAKKPSCYIGHMPECLRVLAAVNRGGPPPPGAFIPKCDSEGNFQFQQCHTSTGECWCVNPETGEEQPFSRSKPGEPKLACEWNMVPPTPSANEPTFPPPDGPCTKKTSVMSVAPGTYLPQCDKWGNYEVRQCHGSTGECWCVDPKTGEELDNTRKGPGDIVICFVNPNIVEPMRPIEPDFETAKDGQLPNGRTGDCAKKSANAIPMPGAFIPQCDRNGDYEVRQCHGSTGYCWCVDAQTGTEIEGTRQGPGNIVICQKNSRVDQPDNAGGETIAFDGPCSRLVASIRVMPGAYIPQCNKFGFWEVRQCHQSINACWCVDEQSGTEIEGTRKQPGDFVICFKNPNIIEPMRPIPNRRKRGQCAKQSTSNGRPMLGAFVPQCDEQGDFKVRQCHGSTGYCWCVDPKSGREISNTKKGPGQGFVICETNTKIVEPVRPPVPDENQSSDGQVGPPMPLRPPFPPMLPEGADALNAGFLCPSTGRPADFGCLGGACPAGHTCVNDRCCETGSFIEPQTPAPLTCSEQRSRFDSSNGAPVVGAYVPQCQDDGSFEAQQCHGSTGHCWCVNEETGTELTGTRTGPGKDSVDCQKPCIKELSKGFGSFGGAGMPVGFPVPVCVENGDYSKQQSSGSSGYSWCVDPKTGKKIEGTERPPVEQPVNCDEI